MHTIIGRLSLAVASFGLLTSLSLPVAAGTVEYSTTKDASGVSRTNTVIGVANPDAPAIEQRIVKDGAIRLNGEEVNAYLSGNTQQWSNGGALYRADGGIDYIWENKKFTDYRWRARGDGLVCIQYPEGFTTSCSAYFRYRNSIWTVVTEVFGEKRDFFGGPDTLLQGNQLSELEPWDPALSGN